MTEWWLFRWFQQAQMQQQQQQQIYGSLDTDRGNTQTALNNKLKPKAYPAGQFPRERRAKSEYKGLLVS